MTVDCGLGLAVCIEYPVLVLLGMCIGITIRGLSCMGSTQVRVFIVMYTICEVPITRCLEVSKWHAQ